MAVQRSWGPGQGEILKVWLGEGVKVLLKMHLLELGLPNLEN